MDQGEAVTVRNDHPAVLAWQRLRVTSKEGRTLLNGVSGVLEGGLSAVMGPSGSGKTTLLNALALRLDPGVKVEGQMHINGRPYTTAILKQIAGYVMQDDLLNGQLTVEETLQYTAKLRCPPTADHQACVEQAMADMGLLHVRGVIVGDPLHKGISGGERKRLCVAVELISQPSLLFLDEPTSGLDSVTALGLVLTLKYLSAGVHESTAPQAPPSSAAAAADPEAGGGALAPATAGGGAARRQAAGCTIMCTIHQPASAIFHQFDSLLLLQSGSSVYQGPASSALAHFERMGYPCPALTNPADHFMDLITERRHAGPDGSPLLHSIHPADMLPDLEQLKSYYKNMEVDMTLGAARPIVPVRKLVPWHRQFKVLFIRAIKEQVRKRNVVLTQLAQAIVVAALIGTVFLHIGRGQSSALRRQPVLFFCVINQGIFAALVVINSYPSERMLVLRERAAGTYYVSAYFVAKMAAELLVQLPIPLVFSAVVYWLVGLQPGRFGVFAAFMALCNLAATSMALMVSTWSRHVDLAIAILPFTLEVSRLFGGFFLPPSAMPAYFSWIAWLPISYVKYTYVGISLNELQGLTLTCTAEEAAKAGGACPVASGEQVIRQLGLNRYSVGMCAGVLMVFIFVCRFLAFVGLRVMKH